MRTKLPLSASRTIVSELHVQRDVGTCHFFIILMQVSAEQQMSVLIIGTLSKTHSSRVEVSMMLFQLQERKRKENSIHFMFMLTVLCSVQMLSEV